MSIPGPHGSEPVGVVIVAAGASIRMAGQDKIFAPLLSRPVLAWTVEIFERSPLVDEIAIAVHPDKLKVAHEVAGREGWKKVSAICPGGARRQDSVRAALSRLAGCEWVAVHDGARPCVSQGLLEQGLEAARESGAAVPGLPLLDTVKRVDERGLVVETLDRSSLWAVQTPQVFRYAILRSAYDGSAFPDATDDAGLLEYWGHAVKVFPGSAENLKVTTPADLMRAEAVLTLRQLPSGPR